MEDNKPNDDSDDDSDESVSTFDSDGDASLFAGESFSLPGSSNSKLTSVQIRALKRATFAAIKERVAREDNGLAKHGRFLAQMKKVIKRMKRSRLLYLFSGKCPVPESRGGHSLDDSTGNDEPESFPNDSKLAFDLITHGLPVADVFVFNIRDICELAAGPWGFCKGCTLKESMVIADCLNMLVSLAKLMGARISLFNIGGSSLAVLYRNIDRPLFEKVIAVHPHLSNLIRHRRISYPDGEVSQIETVRSSLVELLDAIGRPQNLQRMINDIRVEMVRDTSHIYNDEARESAKQMALECFRDGIFPTEQEKNDNLLLDIELNLGRKHYEGLPKRVRKYISSGQRPTEQEMSEVWFRMVYDRECQKKEEERRREAEELRQREAKKLAKAEEKQRREAEELRQREAKKLAKEEEQRRKEANERRINELLSNGKQPTDDEQADQTFMKAYAEKCLCVDAEKCLCVDVSDVVAEQPLIEKKDSEKSKYKGVSKNSGKWEARIYIKGLGKCYLGVCDTEEEAGQLFAKANKKYIVEKQPLTSPDTLDVSDVVAEQPLIEKKDSEKSKYMGVFKKGNKWQAEINIKEIGRFYIGVGDTQEEAAQLFAKANKKYIVDKKPLTLRPKYQKKIASGKVRSLLFSNEVDLNEPASKKQKMKAQSDSQSWWDDHCAAKLTVQDKRSRKDKDQEWEDYYACVALQDQGIVIGVCIEVFFWDKGKENVEGRYYPGKVSRIVSRNEFYVSYDDGASHLEHTKKSTWRLI